LPQEGNVTSVRIRAAKVLIVCAACLAGFARAGGDDGYVKLFNGKNLNGWFRVVGDSETDPAAIWSVRDGVIVCAGAPSGYLMTKDRYTNYSLRMQWRYAASGDAEHPFKLGDRKVDSGNSGVLLHAQPPFNVWPRSVEVQLANSSAGSIFPISGASSDNSTGARDKAKPVGEWNTFEITCKDGSVTVALNGEDVGTVTACNPDSGHIGFQSEGAEIHFRNIEIKALE
jgi:hypothetical protein